MIQIQINASVLPVVPDDQNTAPDAFANQNTEAAAVDVNSASNAYQSSLNPNKRWVNSHFMQD